MHETTTGNWMLALGTATAAGTWAGFRTSPTRQTAELHVDGALTVEPGVLAGQYALVLSPGGKAPERMLAVGNGGTVEFGHDLIELLRNQDASPDAAETEPATLWLADLATGAVSGRCALPRFSAAGLSGSPS